MWNYIHYLTSHSAVPARGQAARGYWGSEFLCWNVTTLPPDLTHLAGRTGNHQETHAWEIVCHFQLISSSRLEDVNSWKWSGQTSYIFTILLASLAILYEKRFQGYNYDLVLS